MLMFVWLCVMTSAFFPNGERLAALQANALQNQIRQSVERPVMTLGWASRDAEFAPPPARATVHDQIRAAQAALETLPARTPRARKRTLAA
ncbi:MAG TPA: hypothetical protein VG841_16115 [Caulobacterales bacterium]|nr:hypothetical protein [Caulobacterales bacterium]